MNYRLFFSPTGGTARATELVCGAMETPFVAVDLTLPAARGQHHWLAADDLVVFGLPVYGGRLPQVPGLFDGLRGENTPAVLCACYGNRHYDDMLLEWKTEMEKRGFICIAAAAIVIPHVYSGVLGHGRPDEADLPAIREFARAVMNKKDRTSVTVPGSFPYKKWEKPFRTPEKTAGCVKCGLCQKVCPTAAINDDFVGDPAACIQCMKCVRVCPVGCRQMDMSAVRAYLESNYSVRRENEFFL